MANAILKALGLAKPKAKKRQTITYRRRAPDTFWTRLTAAADRKAFNWQTRRQFYSHLAAQVENGIAVPDAIEGYAKILIKRKRKSSAALVENIARRMREGMPLRNAIDIAAPRDEIALIAGGELSGQIGAAMDIIISSHDRVEDVVKAYREAMVMPLFYMAMTYLVLWIIGGWVMPQITLTLPESKVTGIGLLMYQAADLSQSWLAVVPIILTIVLALVVRRSLPRWTGAKRISAERFFPYSFYRDIEGFKWLISFAGMLQAGMTDVKILIAQMKTASPWLRERLYHVHFRMTEGGMGLGSALEAKGRDLPPFEFPNPDIIDSLTSVEAFSDFHERVSRVTARWAKEIEENSRRRAKSMGLAAEMCVYAVMALLMIAINSVTMQLGSVGG
ncbi:MAG: type II secretion system F family protein [Rhodanobacter sp.]|jgi:type II secretory pathway component PulF